MKVFEAQEQAEKDAKAKAEGKVRPRPLRAAKEPPKRRLTGCIEQPRFIQGCMFEDCRGVGHLFAVG